MSVFAPRVLCGIDRLESVKAELRGLRLGLITGPSGVTKDLIFSSQILFESLRLTALFAPEHGIRGERQAGDRNSETTTDPVFGVPVYSLFGENTAPTEEMLETVDALLFDIQDVGARFYTYLYTLTRTMKRAAQCGVPVYVFDRPNPLGLTVIEGNVLNTAFSSFVGEYAIPTRYALTIGEFAEYINATEKLGCELHVVPCEGLDRTLYWPDTGLPFVPPSPNLPTFTAALTYIGTCLLEGTNLSEGRGTAKPFELVGAPWLDSRALLGRMNAYRFEGVLFRRAWFTPTFSKHKGERCEGLQLHVTDYRAFRPFEVGLRLLDEIRELAPEFAWDEKRIDRLFGDDLLRTRYRTRDEINRFLEENEARLRAFRTAAAPFYRY